MSKNLLDQYEDLLDMENNLLFSNISSGKMNTHFDPFDDDSEDFLTSKEIVKMKLEKGEDVDNIILPDGPIEIEEDIHFKRYTKKREHKYTETELAEIRKSCENTIVHDYSEYDIYHISDEERAKNDSLAELRMKLNGLKKTYRQIDKYVLAMRIVVEAWEMIEEKDNFIHSKEDFFNMVSTGRIYNNSIIMPRMKGLDKYNMDVIIKYISNPELDPAELVPEKSKSYEDDWYDQLDDDQETEEEMAQRMLSVEEAEFIRDNMDSPPAIKVHDIKPKYIKGYDQRSFGKKKSKLNKHERAFQESLHDILKRIQNNPNNRDSGIYSYRSALVTSSLFEPAIKEDDIWDKLYFDGSWANESDTFLLDLATDEELSQYKAPGDRYLTQGDKELQQFFRIMEDNGLNVVELRRRMNMSEDQLKKSEQKRVSKHSKKVESALLQRITKLNDNPKFKKLIAKAEKAINNQMKDY